MSDRTTPDRSGPARSRATIRDVAALAGVGIKTVSRVINEEANVSDQTKERVERAIAALNFQPHLGAGTLRRGDRRTLTVGLLLDAVDNPFSAAINRAVEVVATARDTAVFAASFGNDAERERTLIQTFTRRRVDGLILTTISPDHGYLQVEREQGTPIVFVDRPPVGLLADAVVTDNAAAARTATRHLIRRGHRRIAFLGDDRAISTAVERCHGFEEAMLEAGLSPDLMWHAEGRQADESTVSAVLQMLALSDPPTAVFSSQNLVTVGAVRALHLAGREQDLALIGFDDVVLADVIRPALTVMAQDPVRIGTLAAQRMFARLDGDTSPERTTVVPATLIPRGSGEIPPPENIHR